MVSQENPNFTIVSLKENNLSRFVPTVIKFLFWHSFPLASHLPFPNCSIFHTEPTDELRPCICFNPNLFWILLNSRNRQNNNYQYVGQKVFFYFFFVAICSGKWKTLRPCPESSSSVDELSIAEDVSSRKESTNFIPYIAISGTVVAALALSYCAGKQYFTKVTFG